MDMTDCRNWDESIDLRNAPYRGSPGVQLPYGHVSARSKATMALPVGTQARFIKLSSLAAAAGYPINTMITIAWDKLFASRKVRQLRTMAATKRIDTIIERLRHWLTHRGMPSFYIWVREQTRNDGEHFHIGLHVGRKWRAVLASMLEVWTEEPAWIGRHPRATEGEFACGECRSWHASRDTFPRRAGYFLAAYLGKGEPSQIERWGKWRNNEKKPVRGRSYGGGDNSGRYDSDQGIIIGTEHRRDRFFVSVALQGLEKAQKKKSCAIAEGQKVHT